MWVSETSRLTRQKPYHQLGVRILRHVLRHDIRESARGSQIPAKGTHRFEPTRVEGSPPLGIDLRGGEFRTVLWATGYRPDNSWLQVPVLDRKGRIRHDGGIVDSPGMYLLGMPFLRRRRSSLIDGAAGDASALADHLARSLDQRAVPSNA